MTTPSTVTVTDWVQEADRHLSAANAANLSATKHKGVERHTFTVEAHSHRLAALSASILALTSEMRTANTTDDRMCRILDQLAPAIEVDDRTAPSGDGDQS